MNREMFLERLPQNLSEREMAIEELGKNEENGQLLFELIKQEKGRCKSAAQKALAQLDYPQAAPMWRKMLKGKTMGEKFLMPSCSDCVSDAIASGVYDYLLSLFQLSPQEVFASPEQFERFTYAISIMLGKGTESMQEVYRLAAEHTLWTSQIQRQPRCKWDKPSTWVLNDGILKIWDSTPEELEKIFPVVLTASIVKSKDKRLMNLAKELYAQYEGSWFIPVFMSSILVSPPEQVFDEYAKYLQDKTMAVYLYNTLGMVIYSYKDITEVWVSWGNHRSNSDTRVSFSQKVELDERWLFKLAESPEEEKPVVTFQSYSRCGIQAQDYDEMLLSLLPKEMEDGPLKQKLADYFSVRAKPEYKYITLYTDALERFC